MITFPKYILLQKDRDDYRGDFAQDFIRVVNNPDIYGELKQLDTETLIGFYKTLPTWVCQKAEMALIELWQEWLTYKHIGLKYDNESIGYLYFLRIPNKQVFKIGKTKLNPEIRKLQIESAEKIKVEIYNWIRIKNFDLIEMELKKYFKKYQIQREWFQFEFIAGAYCAEIDEAIEVYSKIAEDVELMRSVYDE
ncbi:MAG TPA: hypothetical protein DCX45_03470 [Acinetobacter junii]|nr:hypothetical protein [Acinetobacter junii]